MSTDKPPLKPPSPQEWETLIDDFQNGRETAWTSNFSVSSILDLSLSSILKRDFPISLKHSLIVFIEEFAVSLFTDSSDLNVLSRLVETLRALVQAPVDPVQATYALKEQMMVSTTSIFISLIDGFDNEPQHEHHLNSVESLVELLLAVINRPNHALDRQTRAIASECLRELEKSFPCLLSDIAGHLWSLCQSERTHASQCYILLFTQVIHNIVVNRVGVSILNTSVPFVPFNVPQWVLGRGRDGGSGALNYKELRRAMSFLLEWPQVFTPCGMLEFMGLIVPVAVALELQASMLKVQFFGMIYSYDPILFHVVLRLYMHFLDAFNDQEGEIARRLVLISGEAQCPLVFRLLSLHWLLGFFHGYLSSGLVGKKKLIADMGFSFYPGVFDALSLKILKLDLLALCSMSAEDIKSEGIYQGSPLSAVKIFDEGLVSVSAFKWMPPWSTETAVAFRTFHKFLMGASSHSENDFTTVRALIDSPVFRHVQEMLVELMLEFERLVPVVVAFIDRLSVCKRHYHLGECLLQTLDEKLLPKVTIDYDLVAYFPIFDKIAENQSIPPCGLLELLLKLMIFIVKKHGPDTELRSWSQGSKVLGISRTMMMHHHSSRLFVGLSKLLAFTSLYFPDLEVRDNARIYLRMLICVPGRKLRELLNLGEQLPVIAPSAQPGSYFSVQSPRLSHDPKKSRNVLAYIHLERMVALLVKQSWSLSLSTLGLGNEKPDNIGGIKDKEQNFDDGGTEMSSNVQEVSEIQKVNLHEPLRVLDSKISEMLITLRKHFSCIPDFRHMVGIKVKISCFLSFESLPFCQTMGFDRPVSDEVDKLPAIYATVLRFLSSSPYGSIPSYHIPFLLGNPPQNNDSLDSNVSLHIVPVGKDIHEDDNFRSPVTIELEPREPTPGLVDVFLETNAENGQIIRGQLPGITVGIEDMFLNAVLPLDIDEHEIPLYKSDLFTALWEACGNPSNFGREIFPLKGGKGVAAINGTQSVKLLDVPSTSLILRTECYLASFVVTVIGAQLVDLLKGGGIINDVIWKDSYSDCLGNGFTSATKFDDSPLRLKYIDDEDESENYNTVSRRNLGCIHIMIFLPPRFHLLLQMEVCDVSTLVRIRTDYWPCLAYIDDYLEALYLA